MKDKRALSVLVVVIAGIVLGWSTIGGTAADAPAAPAPSASAPVSTWSPGSSAAGASVPVGGLPVVSVADLPAQADDTLRAIAVGGPFRYVQDGTVFGNYERQLPARARGYYTEYTVPTPGSPDRGARRIVVGEGGDFYYTDDHYSSFSRIMR
ncbi:MAG: ribonuclease domain-containing protein [Nocardioides sp.]